MIKKERKIPLTIKKYEALLRRLPKNHPKREQIEEELAKSLAGYQGEKAIDYYLDFLPQDRYYIFHDLRLKVGDKKYTQIDTCILTSRFLLILEVKNISGTLFFDQSFHQLIRTKNEKEEGFPDPVLQVKRQQHFVTKWLQNNRFPSIPIETFIVISHPSSIIKTAPRHKEIYEKVLHSAYLPQKIEQLEKCYQKDILTLKVMKKISRHFIKKHTPLDFDVLSQFELSKSEILSGVHCPTCFTLPLVRKRGTWLCQKCPSSYKDAHVQTLHDYALLISPTITNRECRDFLHLSSPSIASKLLVSLSLKHWGTYKNRTYILTIR